MLRELEAYFEGIVEAEPGNDRAGQVAWRRSCFEAGARYADFVEEEEFPVAGKRVLDLACAWGGHAIAFANRGAQVVGADLNHHQFPSLNRFAQRQGMSLSLAQASCEQLPFAAGIFDLVLAFELVEHIPSPEALAAEVWRVLRPGGICLLSTPARLPSVVWGEQHYQVKGLPLLPFRWQGWVATKLLGRSYPFPITRQYLRADQVIAPFVSVGFTGRPIVRGRRAGRLQGTALEWIAEQLFWSFFVLRKVVHGPT